MVQQLFYVEVNVDITFDVSEFC